VFEREHKSAYAADIDSLAAAVFAFRR